MESSSDSALWQEMRERWHGGVAAPGCPVRQQPWQEPDEAASLPADLLKRLPRRSAPAPEDCLVPA